MRYQYTGDIDLRYGGDFIDIRDFGHNYANCVSVTDLSSAIGFDDAYLIERITVCIPTDNARELDVPRINQMIDVCGYTLIDNAIHDGNGGIYPLKSTTGKMLLIEAIKAYGHYDRGSQETVVIGKDSPMEFKNWRADKRLRANVNLRKWVMREYLK